MKGLRVEGEGSINDKYLPRVTFAPYTAGAPVTPERAASAAAVLAASQQLDAEQGVGQEALGLAIVNLPRLPQPIKKICYGWTPTAP